MALFSTHSSIPYYTYHMTKNLYHQSLGELSKIHQLFQAEQGVYVGKPINGYLKVKWTEVHQVDEEKKVRIIAVFKKAAKGTIGLRALLEEAHRLELTSSRGEKLSLNSLHLILTNPFYSGMVRIGSQVTLGKHEPIIDKKLFEKVQEKLKSRRCFNK